MKKMRKLFPMILVAILLLVVPLIALAQTTSTQSDILNYPLYTCKENGGGLWQQLADGTWAPPGDPLNSCQTGGMAQNWTGDPNLNPWLRSGIDYNNPGYQSVGQYPWGYGNYPGGYQNYSDWLTNCVLMESILPRQECQMYPTYGSYYPGTQIHFRLGKSEVYASLPSGNKTSSLVMSAVFGYIFSKIFS